MTLTFHLGDRDLDTIKRCLRVGKDQYEMIMQGRDFDSEAYHILCARKAFGLSMEEEDCCRDYVGSQEGGE